jgi:hypothetical protein
MYLERKQDLSIYFWLEDLMSPHPMVTVNDGYPDEDLVLPSVTVEAQTIKFREYEMGNRIGRRERFWVVDILALVKTQRDEITSIITNSIEDGIPIYDYDEGFVSPTQIGLLRPFDVGVTTIRIFPSLVEKMYWRNTIRFYTEYNAT